MIIRAVHNKNNPYFIVRRDTAQDKQLPARALGLLIYLMSKPDTWEPSVEDICRRFPDIGHKQAYRLINDTLIPLGYARRVAERVGGRIVRWVVEIYETPVAEPDGQNCQLVPHGQIEHVAAPDGHYQMAILTSIENTEVQNTESKELINKENTEIGADAQTVAKSKRESDARTMHVAIQTCREVAKQFPPKELWDKLITTLGDAPNVVLLAECRAEWVERGYNRASWKWATEWYQTGVPPRVANSPPKQTSNANVGKSPAPAPSRASDAFMADAVEDLIEHDDIIGLGEMYDAIIKRGGAKAEWEIAAVAYYELHKDEPATPEMKASLNTSINALVHR